MGEWEWCLVLLEELEQHGMEQDGAGDDDDDNSNPAEADPRPPPPLPPPSQTAPTAASAATSTSSSGEELEAETVLRVELDESGTPVTATAAAPDDDGEAVSAETLAAYTAAVRACGEGRAGVHAVVGILDRMRWAGVAPGEGTYAAAISAFRACGGVWDGAQEAAPQGEAQEEVPVEGAARTLVEYEKDRGGTGWASPFLYRCDVVCVCVCVCVFDVCTKHQQSITRPTR